MSLLERKKIGYSSSGGVFAREDQQEMRKRVTRIPKQVMERLVRYEWPGNIRELETS